MAVFGNKTYSYTLIAMRNNSHIYLQDTHLSVEEIESGIRCVESK